jgi:hypothetical protein
MRMMKLLLIFIFEIIFGSSLLYSQSVAINNDASLPNSSAMLDIKSSTKGLLIPRMTLAQRGAISLPAIGLLVYQTDVAQGFYYFNGTIWINLTIATSAWNVAGNAGTNPASTFIGTTDNNPLMFRVNNLYAGQLHPIGNVFFGRGAGQNTSSTTPLNVGIGDSSLYSNSTGSSNVSIGNHALFMNSSGKANIAIGENALHDNTSTGFNLGIGNSALYKNVSGVNNTAVGMSSLTFNNSGNDNTGLGYLSLALNANGTANTAIGSQSLYSNNGVSNTAVGVKALYQNFNGSTNIAIGDSALYSNFDGYNNTAVGYEALFGCTRAGDNTAIGTLAMPNSTFGDHNTSVGYYSMLSLTEGSGNSAIGEYSLTSITTGSYNIGIGSNPGACSEDFGDINNSITIGNDINLCTENSNYALFGTTRTTWTGGNTQWFTYSDARIKTNVQENVVGLPFIMKLRPVTYRRSLKALVETKGVSDKVKDYPEKYDIEKIRMSGFLAQEVEQAANEVNYNFDGIVKPKSAYDLYSLSYSSFVVPLVKAVQEQQAIIDQQQKQIDDLLKRVEALEKK